jgi:hypothetical protein
LHLLPHRRCGRRLNAGRGHGYPRHIATATALNAPRTLGVLQVGFVTSVRLFAFWGLLMAMEMLGTTMCMAIGAVMRQQSRTMALMLFILLILVATSGFTITKSW